MFKQPQPMGTAHSSMAEDERGVNAVSDQEKGKNSVWLNSIQEAQGDLL